jgi:predicted Zn-ribbon and HTH transcriptional regulator
LRVLNLKLLTISEAITIKELKKIMTKNEENKTQEDLEWEQRILCSDESCIGVIGPDGRCKECGLPYSGPFDVTKTETVPSDIEEDDPEEEINEESEEIETLDTETLTDSEWEQRTLCSDESCIGVIGPDGLCKECGKPYESEEKIVDGE